MKPYGLIPLLTLVKSRWTIPFNSVDFMLKENYYKILGNT